MERLCQSVLDTAFDDVEVIFYIDDDDVASMDQAEALRLEFPTLAIVSVVGPRIVLSECWNVCAAAANGEILFHCGDDIVFRTEGWDVMVTGAFDLSDDKILFVHGRDGFHDERFGTHGFIHRRWVDTVGYFVPPYFSSDWNDAWLNDVANVLGRRVFLPDVYTEHLHPDFGKAELDLTHRERIERGAADQVQALYESTEMYTNRHLDEEKLRAVMS